MPEITKEVEVKIDFSVYCDCGNGICGNCSNDRYGNLVVEPCETCIEKARDEGYKQGYNDHDNEGGE